MTTYHTRAAPIPKKLYCFKWQNVIGLYGAPGRAEGDLGRGRVPSITKSKAFIKNVINWYQNKTQGRLEEEAGREGGYTEGGPEPRSTHDGIQAEREGVEGQLGR